MRRLDKISSLCLLLLAIGIITGSYKLSIGTLQEPGAGFFPLCSGVALGVLSLLIFLKSSLTNQDKTGSFWPSKRAILKIISAILTLLLYAIFLEYLGFLLCTFLSMLFFTKVIEPRKWFSAIFFSAITSVSSYILFEILLKSQLPRGVLMGS